MKIASKPVETQSHEERKKLGLFSKDVKTLENASKMQVPTDFKDQLEEPLNQICAHTIDRESGGFISRDIIK